MLTLAELAQNVARYRDGSMSLAEFHGWLEDHSNGAYAVPEISGTVAAVEAALSEYFFDGMDESLLKQELAVAICPFANRSAFVQRTERNSNREPRYASLPGNLADHAFNAAM